MEFDGYWNIGSEDALTVFATATMSHAEFQTAITKYVDGGTCAKCFCRIPYGFVICDDCFNLAHKARWEYDGCNRNS